MRFVDDDLTDKMCGLSGIRHGKPESCRPIDFATPVLLTPHLCVAFTSTVRFITQRTNTAVLYGIAEMGALV
jgi:hypothetical protein